MDRVLRLTRYLVLVPIFGLLLAAAYFFFFGGISMVLAIGAELFSIGAGDHESVPFVIEIVEYVHQFLVGTVLFITAIGFYQLFIKQLDLPGWLDVEGTDELETALIGVTVVVLAVHFMTVAFAGENVDLLSQGLGTGAVIAALALFLGLRSWGERQKHLADKLHDDKLKEAQENRRGLNE